MMGSLFVGLLVRMSVHVGDIVRPGGLETRTELFQCFDGGSECTTGSGEDLRTVAECARIVIDKQVTDVKFTKAALLRQIFVGS